MKTVFAAWAAGVALFAASVEIRTLDGGRLRPLEPHGAANVLFFVTTDCPISNAYAPEIQRLCAAYRTKGVDCALIYEDLDVKAEAVRTHLTDHHYSGMPAAIDRDGSLAAQMKATITPETIVVDRQGAVRYRGRIDNLYVAFGRSRQVVTSHDLQDALNSVVAGKPVASPSTEPIGCYIMSPTQRSK